MSTTPAGPTRRVRRPRGRRRPVGGGLRLLAGRGRPRRHAAWRRSATRGRRPAATASPPARSASWTTWAWPTSWPATTASTGCGPTPSAAPSSCAGPSIPSCPDHGYVITRKDLDHLVAPRAEKAGRDRAAGDARRWRRSSKAAWSAAPWSRPRTARDAGAARRSGPATWWWPTGPTPASAARLGTSRNRAYPLGMAIRGYYDLAPPRRALDRELARHPGQGGQRPARLRLDLPGRRRPGQRRHRAALHLQPVEGRQHHPPDGELRRGRPRVVGPAPRDAAAARRPAAASRWACRSGPTPGPTYLVVGDAGGVINPFNGEGIAYAYETGRMAADAVARGPGHRRRHGPADLPEPSSRPPTACTSRWPGRS